MTELERQRLDDFKRVLTYHLTQKIRRHLKGNYRLYYEAPRIWARWRSRQLAYDKRIYRLIVIFNQTSLSAHQVKHIFGKGENGRQLGYSALIAQDKDIKVFGKGTVCMGGCRYQVRNRYQLPVEAIGKIFNDPELLERVVDAGSDYYTPRQRRLIFTQINGRKNYRYMTREEKIGSMGEEERINALLDGLEARG